MTSVKRYLNNKIEVVEIQPSKVKEFRVFFDKTKSNSVIDSFYASNKIFTKENENLKEVIKYFESSKEIKEESKKQNVKVGQFTIVSGLVTSTDPFIMSFPRYMSVISYKITWSRLCEKYDWSKGRYDGPGKSSSVDFSVLNRLAESIGLHEDSRLYTLYVQGVENLFNEYPEEVLAICIYRAGNLEKLKLKGTRDESLKSVVAKVIKQAHRSKLEGTVEELKGIIDGLSKKNIQKYIAELQACKPQMNVKYDKISSYLIDYLM